MLTDADIKKFIDAGKEVFTTKADFESLRSDFRSLQTSVDNYAKRADIYFQEMVVLSHRVQRMEEWIRQVSEKIGVEYKP